MAHFEISIFWRIVLLNFSSFPASWLENEETLKDWWKRWKIKNEIMYYVQASSLLILSVTWDASPIADNQGLVTRYLEMRQAAWFGRFLSTWLWITICDSCLILFRWLLRIDSKIKCLFRMIRLDGILLGVSKRLTIFIGLWSSILEGGIGSET